MTISRSAQRFVIWPKALWQHLIGVPQLLGVGQAIAVLRGEHDGLGRKENTLSSAQVMDVQKVRNFPSEICPKPDIKT